MKRALISVYDKFGVLPFAKMLQEQNIEIISTGKTYSFLKESGVNAILLSDYTSFPEVMGGRVKTLHPKIHGGILADRSVHSEQMQKHEIPALDIVVVNLYPFEDRVKNNSKEEEIIENIDIGGVALLRAAAKNFKHVCVLSDPKDYKDYVVDCDLGFRKKMALKAFQTVASYDAAITNWFSKEQELPDLLAIGAKKRLDFRYGENPHQKAAFYSDQDFGLKQVQGKELSYNNLLDADAAICLLKEFKDPTCVIVKHNNPCGVASCNLGLLDAYLSALDADSLSAFGGIVAFNGEVSEKIAKEISKIFFEVIIAKDISNKALDILASKKNLRVLIGNLDNLSNIAGTNNLQIKSAFGGFLVQEQNNELFKNFDIVTKKQPTQYQLDQMKFAQKICKHVKSNAIVVAKDYKTFGIGAGQMSRIKSVQIALEQAKKEKGLVMASDAFFPFADSIEVAAQNGVTAILQPGGSLKDKDVIKAADDLGIAMVFCGTRHFRH